MIDYEICTLYSGSSGNATLVRSPKATILIDAGKSARALCRALASVGASPADLDAVFITHEHSDHISALPVLTHKYPVPIHILYKSALIFRGSNDRALCECLQIELPGYTAHVGDMTVTSFPTPHDSADACGYRIDIRDENEEYVSVGIATDIGHVTDALRGGLCGCRSVVLESNHDPDMLQNGPYPADLKRRIRSPRGHLSNPDATLFATELYENGTRDFLLAHLSEQNNHPDLVMDAFVSALGTNDVNIRVASPDSVTWLVRGKAGAVC